MVTGLVRADERAPGGAEVAVTRLETIQTAQDYPISRKAHGIDFLMSNRHLWLRSSRPTASKSRKQGSARQLAAATATGQPRIASSQGMPQ